MNSQLAYEIGAVFFLAALLMFGSLPGLSRRFRLGGGAMVALGVALALFGVYHYWDQILALAAPTDSAEHVSAPAAPSSTSAPAKSAPANHRSTRAPEPIEKIIVVEQVPAERVIVQAPDKLPAVEKPETETPPQSEPDPCEKSPYESKARRAMKSMGCGLHILRKKDAQQP
jgi:hypothetical protein